jgi:hypothetical protein
MQLVTQSAINRESVKTVRAGTLSSYSEVTECDQTESDQTRHYALLESDKALFGMR